MTLSAKCTHIHSSLFRKLQGRMAVGFVDLEKAYDTVPREMVMATVRWMGVPEAEAMMVEAMYERTKGRVVVGSGLSEVSS